MPDRRPAAGDAGRGARREAEPGEVERAAAEAGARRPEGSRTGPRAGFAFTKLVVHDLEGLAGFYREAYGLHAVNRVRGERIGDEAIDEIMLSPDPEAPWGSLVLLAYPGRGPSPEGEVILGFTTDDLPALLDRVRAAGGAVHAPTKEMPALGLRVAFATDPEGHLAELVQMLGQGAELP